MVLQAPQKLPAKRQKTKPNQRPAEEPEKRALLPRAPAAQVPQRGRASQLLSGRNTESPPPVGRNSGRGPRDGCVAGGDGWPPGCVTKRRVGVTRPTVALTLSSPVGKPNIRLMRILSLALGGRGGPWPLRGQKQGPKVALRPNVEATLSTLALQQHPQALQAVRVREARKCPMMVRGQKEGKQLARTSG